MNLYQKYVNHLKENRMTYREHFLFAVSHGVLCLYAGLMLIIHGLFPCFYQHAGSDLVHKLDIVFTRREKDCAKRNDLV